MGQGGPSTTVGPGRTINVVPMWSFVQKESKISPAPPTPNMSTVMFLDSEAPVTLALPDFLAKHAEADGPLSVSIKEGTPFIIQSPAGTALVLVPRCEDPNFYVTSSNVSISGRVIPCGNDILCLVFETLVTPEGGLAFELVGPSSAAKPLPVRPASTGRRVFPGMASRGRTGRGTGQGRGRGKGRARAKPPRPEPHDLPSVEPFYRPPALEGLTTNSTDADDPHVPVGFDFRLADLGLGINGSTSAPSTDALKVAGEMTDISLFVHRCVNGEHVLGVCCLIGDTWYGLFEDPIRELFQDASGLDCYKLAPLEIYQLKRTLEKLWEEWTDPDNHGWKTTGEFIEKMTEKAELNRVLFDPKHYFRHAEAHMNPRIMNAYAPLPTWYDYVRKEFSRPVRGSLSDADMSEQDETAPAF